MEIKDYGVRCDFCLSEDVEWAWSVPKGFVIHESTTASGRHDVDVSAGEICACPECEKIIGSGIEHSRAMRLAKRMIGHQRVQEIMKSEHHRIAALGHLTNLYKRLLAVMKDKVPFSEREAKFTDGKVIERDLGKENLN